MTRQRSSSGSPTVRQTGKDVESTPLKAFKFPDKSKKMEDHIHRHEMQTGPFPYVVLGARAPSTAGRILEALFSSRRLIATPEMELPDIPPIVCRGRNISLPLAQALKSLKRGTEWVRVSELLVNFTPAVSSSDAYAELRLEVYDHRSARKGPVRSVVSPSNCGVDARISLDYFVHKADISNLELRLILTNSPLVDGAAWGSIRVLVKIEQAAECVTVSSDDTIAVLRLPDSAFRTRKTNPNHVNLMLDQEDMNAMSRFYEAGRIVDPTDASGRQKVVRYAQSEAGSEDETHTSIGAWRGAIMGSRGLSPPPRAQTSDSGSSLPAVEDPVPAVDHDSDILSIIQEEATPSTSSRVSSDCPRPIQSPTTQDNREDLETPDELVTAFRSALKKVSQTKRVATKKVRMLG